MSDRIERAMRNAEVEHADRRPGVHPERDQPRACTQVILIALDFPALLLGRVTSARIAMLGVSRTYRGTLVSAAATALLLSTAFDAAEARGWRSIEISWILEDNAAMLALMARLPAPVTGRWRIHGGKI